MDLPRATTVRHKSRSELQSWYRMVNCLQDWFLGFLRKILCFDKNDFEDIEKLQRFLKVFLKDFTRHFSKTKSNCSNKSQELSKSRTLFTILLNILSPTDFLTTTAQVLQHFFVFSRRAKTTAKNFPNSKTHKTSVFTGHKSLIDSLLSAVPQLLPRFPFFPWAAGRHKAKEKFIWNRKSAEVFLCSAFAKVDLKSISNNNRMLLLWPVEVKKAQRERWAWKLFID